jgi:hypothetical protein
MHDAYDYWTLAVNACVAAGTIGAVVVALWLGLASRTEDANREARRERAERRQVAVVLRPNPDRQAGGDYATVDVVNGSTELVSNVTIELTARANPKVAWLWRAEGPPPYLTAKGTYRASGSYHVVKPDGTADRSSFVDVARNNLHWMMAWQDPHGVWWARRDGGEPYRSDGAEPGRDVELDRALTAQGPTKGQRALRRLRLRKD